MPLPLLFPAAIAFGLLHALLAERSLAQGTQTMLLAAGLFGLAILMPVEIYLLHDYNDWAYLYLLAPARVPSAVDLLLLLFAAALVPGAAWLGARWLGDDARYRVLRALLALAGVGLVIVAVGWRRLTHFGTYAQYKGSYGLKALTECSLGPSVLLVLATLAAGMMVSARVLRR